MEKQKHDFKLSDKTPSKEQNRTFQFSRVHIQLQCQLRGLQIDSSGI